MAQHETLARILGEHPYYSAKRLAALMGVSPNHLHTLARRAEVHTWPREDLENVLDRIPPATLKRAMKAAREARADG